MFFENENRKSQTARPMENGEVFQVTRRGVSKNEASLHLQSDLLDFPDTGQQIPFFILHFIAFGQTLLNHKIHSRRG
jgi:hypothetical protein